MYLSSCRISIIFHTSFIVTNLKTSPQNQPQLENHGYEESHPPANTPGGLSDGGPRSNYSERANTPTTPFRQDEAHEEEVRLISFAIFDFYRFQLVLDYKDRLCLEASILKGYSEYIAVDCRSDLSGSSNLKCLLLFAYNSV